MLYFILFCIFFLSIGRARRLRKGAWTAQIALGDVIAVKRGRFVQRYVRKRMHKLAGRTINKFKRWK